MTYILGFDGGGTKTECVLTDAAGAILARALGGPSNSSRIGVEAAIRNVVAAAETALGEAQLGRTDVEAIGAGLAGTTDPERRERVCASLQTEFPNARVVMMTDLDAALAAAPQGPAIVLIAGTGSAAIGRNAAGQVVRVGGHGRFSSDEGSAFDVGKSAIAAAMTEREKTGADSPIGAGILKVLHCASWEDVRERAGATPDDVYPSIFPVIAAAAEAGVVIARHVLSESTEKLGSLAARAAAQLGLANSQFWLVKTGGMLGRSQFFDTELAGTLRKQLPTSIESKLRMSPAQAAAFAARDAHD